MAEFHESDFSVLNVEVDSQIFFEDDYDSILGQLIAHVVNTEGPVRTDVLTKRIARVHGWARTGARIQSRIVGLAQGKYPTSKEDVGLFYWPMGSNTSRFSAFRHPCNETVRPVDEIALPELISLACELRRRQHFEDEAAAVLAMAHAVGLQKLRTASRHRLSRAWRDSMNYNETL
ncbi:DUF3320 domain-containing protein [Acidithiobacillus sp. HP-6]|nr:DUF3320 domain-containing protein [Acidithiobacillus sp. HP-6]MBE7567886.1 DUF3320 domain-containing protein [Acidithiobacillus sp. HP-11]MBE7570388.1 DUF3320 domain-containing protein [Acidithiobacillus sp. HP-2]